MFSSVEDELEDVELESCSSTSTIVMDQLERLVSSFITYHLVSFVICIIN